MANIWLISGGRGAGKTSLCTAVVRRVQAAAWDVAGLLSPAVSDGGRKTGIDVLDLRSGERRRLAIARVESQAHPSAGVQTHAWVFDPMALTWGDRVLKTAVPCDLLVVDELGLLEFERGQGWLSGLAALDSRQYRHAMVVIRPELLAAAQARWPGAQVVHPTEGVRQVDERQAEALADQILAGFSG